MKVRGALVGKKGFSRRGMWLKRVTDGGYNQIYIYELVKE